MKLTWMSVYLTHVPRSPSATTLTVVTHVTAPILRCVPVFTPLTTLFLQPGASAGKKSLAFLVSVIN